MKSSTKNLIALIIASFCLLAAPAISARSFKAEMLALVDDAMAPGATKVQAAGQIEFAFSPGGAQALVLKTIASSQREIRVFAYAFTSAPIAAALIEAYKRRGVDVQVLVDGGPQMRSDRSGKSRAALGALANAGITVRTIDAYAIHHDKVLLVDGVHLQTGSFNYSAAAAKSNSENVIVLWNNPAVVQGYMKHWHRNWTQGRSWQPAY
jgi:phosphatidylserine/phosphatidylglycerophosphate/cardiolipin synthase-like enzyme